MKKFVSGFILGVVLVISLGAMRYNNWMVDGSNDSIDSYVNGVKGVRVKETHIIPPPCPADLKNPARSGDKLKGSEPVGVPPGRVIIKNHDSIEGGSV